MNADNIVISKQLPNNTNVIWIDISKDNPSVKAFINGMWSDIAGMIQYCDVNTIDLSQQEYTLTWNLQKGVNQWSTYIDITLEQLEEALGDKGLEIRSLTGGYRRYSDDSWSGQLQSINASQMYMIKMNEPCQISLSGSLLNPMSQSITLPNGSRWIGYPVNHAIEISEALKSFNPIDGDIISYTFPSGIKLQSVYNSQRGTNGTWVGDLHVLEPGKGYVYTTTQHRSVSFVSLSYNSVVQDIQINDGVVNITKLKIDNEPVENSNNLITSGAVYAALQNIQQP